VQECNEGETVTRATKTSDAVCLGDVPLAGQENARPLISTDGSGESSNGDDDGGGGIALGPVAGCAIAGLVLIVLAVVLARRKQKVAHRDNGTQAAVSTAAEDTNMDREIDRNRQEMGERAFKRATMTSADRLVREKRGRENGKGNGMGENGGECVGERGKKREWRARERCFVLFCAAFLSLFRCHSLCISTRLLYSVDVLSVVEWKRAFSTVSSVYKFFCYVSLFLVRDERERW
jgi:hypothetical protein